jgi:hypothetical protein
MIPPPNPNEKDFSTCQNCRARDATSKKRKREGAIAKMPCSGPVTGHQDERTSGVEQDTDDTVVEDELTEVSTHPTRKIITYRTYQAPVMYINSRELFGALRKAFKEKKQVNFFGTYCLPEDPMVSDSERVRMTTHEIWKVTGYRFT